MKTLYLSSVLMLLSPNTWGKAPAPTKQSLANIMTEVRDPYFKSLDRIKYLQFVQTTMQLRLAKELNTTPANLGKAFIDNPKNMDLLWSSPWIDLQTEFYTTLHQETLSQRWNTRLQKKKITDYGKNLADAMIFHLGKYSGPKEGRLYNRWNTLTINTQGKTKDYRLPYFIFSNSVNTLLSLDAHTPYEQLFPKDNQETMVNPSLSTFLKNTGEKSREEYQELAEKVQLNHRIYIRAVANAAKTVASIHYLTGEFTLPQTESKVSAFLFGFCDGCSSKEKDDYQKSAMSYVINKKKEFSQEYRGAKDIVTTFCSDLKRNGFMFDEPAPVKPANSLKYEVPSMAIDNTRVDKSHIYAQIAMFKIEAVRKTINEHDLGVLFLTNSLSRLTQTTREPNGIHMRCSPESLSYDILSVRSAITEAGKNVEQYVVHINQKVKDSALNSKVATETLEYFTQTNVSSTAEAVMTFPQGINHVVESMYQLDRDVKRRKRVDKIVTWGGTIIGIGLTISGIGAPEGVAILLAVASMTKGAISGVYNFYRAQQEKSFNKELSSAKLGLGNTFYLDGNLSQHYNSYRNLRINYIVDFAGSALSFANIHRMALAKTGGDVAKAHGLIKGGLQKAKAVGEDVGIDQLENLIASMTF